MANTRERPRTNTKKTAKRAGAIASAGLAPLLVNRIDGNTMSKEKLRAKPSPDSILAACRELDLPPGAVAGFETDALGIAAGRAAELCLTVGVDRGGRAETLDAAGADRIVSDLSELLDPILD